MISIQTLISIISVCGAVIFGVLATSRNSKSDIRNDTEERVSMNVILNTKLDNISESVNEIKRDNKEMKENMDNLNERVLLLEYGTGMRPDRRKSDRREET